MPASICISMLEFECVATLGMYSTQTSQAGDDSDTQGGQLDGLNLCRSTVYIYAHTECMKLLHMGWAS